MEYVDPTNCIVTRVNTLRMLLGYDATVDTDLRDRSLDVLVLLLELDPPTMANRLVNLIPRRVHTRLFDGLPEDARLPVMALSVLALASTRVGVARFNDAMVSPPTRVNFHP